MLIAAGVIPQRIDIDHMFCDLSKSEQLAHAHYLIDAMDASAYYPEKWDKVNRHLTAIQMSLSNGGWFTLRDLMEHNRPWTKGLL